MIALTPGGTGFQELAGLYVSNHTSTSLVELLAVLVWVKILRVILALALAVPSYLYIRKRLQ